MFIKIKDFFTITTILLAFFVLPLSYRGHFELAALLILVGSLTDLMDGFYARKTGTGNKFGKEFDVIADLVIYCMAPSIIIFFAYHDYSVYLASLIGVIPLLFGCIRLARFNVKGIEYPGYWMGLPRPFSSLIIIGLINSKIFTLEGIWLVGIMIILILGIMNVTCIPYIGHHKRRLGQGHWIFLGFIAFLFIGAHILGFFWDLVFILGALYILTPLYLVSEKDKKNIKKFVSEWKREIA